MHVFLTGATGLVGGALAGALLDAGHRVTALVRGDGRDVLDMDGRDRIGETTALSGDVSEQGFGMAAPPTDIDLLIHCAATVDFAASNTVHEAVNIGGTAHAIALAQGWGCPLLHVSTAYVCGRADGVIGEARADPQASFTNGYEASKARAEILVEAARADGLVAVIARPAIIVGRLSDGAIARIDGFHHLFRLFGSPLLGDVPAVPQAAFAIVPICHVVAGLMALVGDMAAFDGARVHLVGAEPFAMADMLRIVADYPGTVPARMIAPAAYDPAVLDRRTGMVHRRIGPQFFDYFLRSPRFAGDSLQRIAGMDAPIIDEAAFRRMIDHCVKVGFLDWR
ncbi:male sterility protein [Blastomonas natatoria]|uniref:Male sterility protein n=1 Tax=Blastomonas natatoria TaxID=34015 RepID=A0A2V3V9J1_9SPHN|nr:SDR family oxidoreductase [Blastomonas natatoria]PXW78476.1 male sterility protein [Blastomonas natatoria]